MTIKKHSLHKKFSSDKLINLGEDVDRIINGFLDDLDMICDCDSCKMFQKIFKYYIRYPV